MDRKKPNCIQVTWELPILDIVSVLIALLALVTSLVVSFHMTAIHQKVTELRDDHKKENRNKTKLDDPNSEGQFVDGRLPRTHWCRELQQSVSIEC